MIEGVKFHPQRFFTVKSFIEFQTFKTYKISILRARSIKLCLNTKNKVLNSNLKSKFLYDIVFNFFENEALSWNGLFSEEQFENIGYLRENNKLKYDSGFLEDLNQISAVIKYFL